MIYSILLKSRFVTPIGYFIFLQCHNLTEVIPSVPEAVSVAIAARNILNFFRIVAPSVTAFQRNVSLLLMSFVN
jgi:hypothetical protein